MKKIACPTTALALVAGLTACSPTFNESEARLGGAVLGGAAADAAGANDLGVALGVVGGYVLGGVVNRAQDAGCNYTSAPVRGALNFQNIYDGTILACPNARPGTPFIEELRRSDEWQLVRTSSRRQPSRYSPLLYGRGFN